MIYFLIAALQALDFITTYISLSYGAVEMNPLVAATINSWQGITIKIALTVLLCFWFRWYKNKDPQFAPYLLFSVYGILSFAVINNLYVIYLLKQL